MRDRFDIDQVIKITGLGIYAEQADGGADFDVACQIAVKKIWKAKEYESLEEQNRLLKLPCAVGDTVYTACSWGIESGIVGSIEIISDRVFVNNTKGQMIGEAKNISLTREEAESALKELERGKG